jgi:hypothetical protein
MLPTIFAKANRARRIMTDTRHLADAVRDRYARAARAAVTGLAAGCCDTTCCATSPTFGHLYDDADMRGLLREAVAASLACGCA